MVVAFHKTPRYVTLLHSGTLKKTRVPASELRYAEPIKPKRGFAGRLDRRRKEFKRIGVSCSEKTVKQVVAALRNGGA